MGKFIYADNAATTKLDSDAFNAMQPYFIDEYGNASARYRFSKLSKKALQESRSVIAKCINAKPNEIYFTSGGSESDNWAIKGVMLSSINTSKNEFITSEITYVADNKITLDDEKCEKVMNLIDALNDIDDVQAVYHNLDV